MKLGLRYTRSLLFLIPAVMALTTNITLEGLSIAFGMVALTGAFATMIYLFLHFDQKEKRHLCQITKLRFIFIYFYQILLKEDLSSKISFFVIFCFLSGN